MNTAPPTKVDKCKELLSKLQSSNIDRVSQALDETKINGTCDHIMPMLDILLTHPGNKIESKVYGVLADIREQSAVDVIMQALMSDAYKSFRSEMVSACWQSNLDYSNYFEDFVTLVINEDYMTAFEALTVIDNTYTNVSDEVREEQIARLKVAILVTPSEKQAMLSELIHMLQS